MAYKENIDIREFLDASITMDEQREYRKKQKKVR